jgi:hypothetical protein
MPAPELKRLAELGRKCKPTPGTTEHRDHVADGLAALEAVNALRHKVALAEDWAAMLIAGTEFLDHLGGRPDALPAIYEKLFSDEITKAEAAMGKLKDALARRRGGGR